MSLTNFNDHPVTTEMFRFVSIRNPQIPSGSGLQRISLSYHSDSPSDFYLQLAAIRGSAEPDDPQLQTNSLLEAAANFRTQNNWFPNMEAVEAAAPGYQELYAKLRQGPEEISLAEGSALLQNHTPLDLKSTQRIWDNLLCRLILKTEPQVQSHLIEVLLMDHILRMHGDSKLISSDPEWYQLLQCRLVLPAAIFPLPVPSTTSNLSPEPPETPLEPDWQNEAKALEKVHAQLEKAFLIREEQTAGQLPPLDPTEVGALPSPYLSLNDADWNNLSEEDRTILSSRNLGIGSRFEFALTTLEKELEELNEKIFAEAQLQRQVVAFGGAIWQFQPTKGLRREPCAPEHPVDQSGYEDFYPGGNPCRIRPLGIGDLLKVEQELCCYVPGEVAHIENVLQGEYKERNTRRFRRTEETYASIVEREKMSERDTITSNQFEMHKESATILQEDQAFDVGVSASANYGPVQINVNSAYATSTSTTTAHNQATSYAQNVTDRSLERVIERTREERIYTIIEEFEENNLHGLDNRQGTGHVVGVYRWADKLYKARLVNYGKRLMFEFMVPEPGAFHLWAMAKPGASLNFDLSEPVDPTSQEVSQYGLSPLSQNNIGIYNYHHWGRVYGVVLPPPPPMSKRVAVTFGRDGMGSADKWSVQNQELIVPEGYKASSAIVNRAFNAGGANTSPPTAPYGWTWIQVGSAIPNQRASSGTNVFALNGEEGKLPVSIIGASTEHIAVNVMVHCVLTPKALNDWRKECFQLILQAYQDQKAAFDNALQEARSGYGFGRIGTHPARSAQTIQTELKKGCLTWLNDGEPFWSDALENPNSQDDCQPPTFATDCCVVNETQRIRFLEQAFDWRNMTYLLYPYFYAQKCRWKMLYQLDDSDPAFLDFLQAGMARVVVPVRLGFEEAAMHYLRTREVWSGGQVPAPSSPLYLSIVHELHGNPPGTQQVVSKDWDLRVPTTLTVLQCGSGCIAGDGLPCDCGTGIGAGTATPLKGGSWDSKDTSIGS